MKNVMKFFGSACFICLTVMAFAQDTDETWAMADPDGVGKPVHSSVVDGKVNGVDVNLLANSLDKLIQLDGKVFSSDGNKAKGKELGFVVHDIAEIFPEMVQEDAQGYQSVNYNELLPIMVEAIKEQQHIINDMRAQMTVMNHEFENVESIKNDIAEWKAFLLQAKADELTEDWDGLQEAASRD